MDKTKDISTYNLTDGQTDRQRDHYIEMQTDSQSYRQAVFTQFHFPHNQIIYTPVQTGSGKQGNRETDGQTQRQVNNVSFSNYSHRYKHMYTPTHIGIEL